MYISISEASRLAGISRTAFYKTYINKGKISTSVNDQSVRCIEFSELLRVFPHLQLDNIKSTEFDIKKSGTDTPTTIEELAKLKAENEFLKLHIKNLEEHEAWQREKLDSLLSETIRLLVAPKPAPLSGTRHWWQFWK